MKKKITVKSESASLSVKPEKETAKAEKVFSVKEEMKKVAAKKASPEKIKQTQKNKSSEKTAVKKSSGIVINEEDIRLQAYFNFIARGGSHGRHEDDWYQARQQLLKKAGKK